MPPAHRESSHLSKIKRVTPICIVHLWFGSIIQQTHLHTHTHNTHTYTHTRKDSEREIERGGIIGNVYLIVMNFGNIEIEKLF